MDIDLILFYSIGFLAGYLLGLKHNRGNNVSKPVIQPKIKYGLINNDILWGQKRE